MYIECVTNVDNGNPILVPFVNQSQKRVEQNYLFFTKILSETTQIEHLLKKDLTWPYNLTSLSFYISDDSPSSFGKINIDNAERLPCHFVA